MTSETHRDAYGSATASADTGGNELPDSLFEQHEPSTMLTAALRAGSALVGAGATYALIKMGVDHNIVLRPGVVPEIVGGFVETNKGLREAAPVAMTGSLALGGYYLAAGRVSDKAARLNRLATSEYSGMDDILGAQQHETKGGRLSAAAKRARRLGRGTGIATLAVLITGAASGVEHEISDGPLRPINQAMTLLAPSSDGEKPTLLLQSPNTTFMDDSAIPKDAMNAFVQQAAAEGVKVVTFGKKLPQVDGNSGMALSIPNRLYSQLTHTPVSTNCEDVSVLGDETFSVTPTSQVNVNNVKMRLVGNAKDTAFINRKVVVAPQIALDCIEGGTDQAYFGAAVSGGSPKQIEQLLKRSPMAHEAVPVTEAKFEDDNRTFWQKNGTPIIFQLMAYVGLFGGLAAAGERRSALLRNVREIGMFNGLGVSLDDFKQVEVRRAILETTKGAVIAAPLMPIVAGVFNMAEQGLKVGVGFRELAVGYTIAVGAKLFGSLKGVRNLKKNMDLSQAVKG